MNHLSGRLQAKNLSISGDIKVNAVERSKVPNYGVFSAYVQQDDVLYQTMTVRECIEFAAKLRFIGTPKERKDKVEQIIQDLKLTRCEATKIGGVFIKGVSGGERKRTAIGVELITDPSLIFLDEPTTGLDSYTSTQIMQLLKSLADSGRTIIQTIHQPNSEIFETFDQLMLMANGEIIFFNDSRLAQKYFSDIGFSVPMLANPADYYMSMMSKESIEAELEVAGKSPEEIESLADSKYRQRIELFKTTYQSSDLRNNPEKILKEKQGTFAPIKEDTSSNRVNWCSEFLLLARRNTLNQLRLPMIQFFKFISVIANTIICLIIYAGTFESSKEGV
jgi:ABC-type multidrug transport system ATPase subunit